MNNPNCGFTPASICPLPNEELKVDEPLIPNHPTAYPTPLMKLIAPKIDAHFMFEYAKIPPAIAIIMPNMPPPTDIPLIPPEEKLVC